MTFHYKPELEYEPRKIKFQEKSLTNRQLQLCGLLYELGSYTAVAKKLRMSNGTVYPQFMAILTKLGLQNKMELVVWFHKRKENARSNSN